MSKAHPGTIPMIEYRGGSGCDLFGFDFEVEDEMSWGCTEFLNTPNSASYSTKASL